MDLRMVAVDLLDPWEKNPRGITVEGLERLKRQILKLGMYKPLIVRAAGRRFEVLGGNMRLLALRALKVKEAQVSVVEPASEAEAMEFALSDNDRIGKYDLPALAKLILPFRTKIELEDYRITLGDEVKIGDLLKDYGPGLEVKEKELDESIPTSHVCQECGYKW